MTTITNKSARQRVTRDANRRRRGKRCLKGKEHRTVDWLPMTKRYAADLTGAIAERVGVRRAKEAARVKLRAAVKAVEPERAA